LRYPLGKKEKEKKEGRWAFWKVKCPLFVASGFILFLFYFEMATFCNHKNMLFNISSKYITSFSRR
jgi:hypothetical protein